MLEIARALSRDARGLIMDEPTAALSQREVARLFAVVDTLRARGVAMLFVGHRMDEIFAVADRIAVLRDGTLIGVELAAHLSRDRAIQMELDVITMVLLGGISVWGGKGRLTGVFLAMILAGAGDWHAVDRAIA